MPSHSLYNLSRSSNLSYISSRLFNFSQLSLILLQKFVIMFLCFPSSLPLRFRFFLFSTNSYFLCSCYSLFILLSLSSTLFDCVYRLTFIYLFFTAENLYVFGFSSFPHTHILFVLVLFSSCSVSFSYHPTYLIIYTSWLLFLFITPTVFEQHTHTQPQISPQFTPGIR